MNPGEFPRGCLKKKFVRRTLSYWFAFDTRQSTSTYYYVFVVHVRVTNVLGERRRHGGLFRFFQVDVKARRKSSSGNMVVCNGMVLFSISLCAVVASCDSTFQKPLDPFTLLRYDKRTAGDEPPNNAEKNVSVEFDEYPVSGPALS